MNLRALLFVLASGFGFAFTAPVSADATLTFNNHDVVVVDGDTFMVADKVYDLFGVDAPELGQQCGQDDQIWPCGKVSALLLHKAMALAAVPLHCEIQRDKPPIPAVVCSEGTRDLSLMLLREGMAVADKDAPYGYHRAEADAHTAKLGVWRSAFVRPEDWRAALPARGRRTTAKCPFVGQLRNGEHIVILPTIDEVTDPPRAPQPDERLFCSDTEAVAMGWQLRPAPHRK